MARDFCEWLQSIPPAQVGVLAFAVVVLSAVAVDMGRQFLRSRKS